MIRRDEIVGSKAMRETDGAGNRWPPPLLADLEISVPEWRASSGQQAQGIVEQVLGEPGNNLFLSPLGDKGLFSALS